jgi:transposase
MRFYSRQHGFYCGIDLHARTMYVCILDQAGNTLVHQEIAADGKAFLKLIAPYRDDLVVCVECMFTWYWLADLCAEHGIAFVLGHALYMGAIHGGKSKNDKIDSAKIAQLLRGGNLPIAYAYPKGMRETRDLLRRRTYLVHHRAEALAHIQNTNSQYNLKPFAKRLSRAADREELAIAPRFEDASVRKMIEIDLALIDQYDAMIADLEEHLIRTAKVDDVQTYQRLQTIPGVGKILALILLYEIHDIHRFASVGQFLSYARLVRCVHESAGKKKGTGGKKIGNPHLKWAFSEAACLMQRGQERVQKWLARQTSKHGKKKALAILAARLGRAVYFMLRKRECFDEERFWTGAAAALPS